jgi:hypothetical protein
MTYRSELRSAPLPAWDEYRTSKFAMDHQDVLVRVLQERASRNSLYSTRTSGRRDPAG